MKYGTTRLLKLLLIDLVISLFEKKNPDITKNSGICHENINVLIGMRVSGKGTWPKITAIMPIPFIISKIGFRIK